MNNQMHPFHMVNESPWPILGSMALFTTACGLATWMHHKTFTLLNLGLTSTLLTSYQWWRDIVREGTFQGHHTTKVQTGLRYGMILFITSEVLFFFGFFWTFYFTSTNPDHALGLQWPPKGIKPLSPIDVPLLNTMILLASGVTITWSHHSIMTGLKKNTSWSLLMTTTLGLYFTLLQASEYYNTAFSISDGTYGATFFVATGFHGLHVMIGTTFLIICLMRQIHRHFTTKHYFGFEAAAWYWHFVDVVWIFLYTSIYWWGS
uniref:Cytochrome c oxidase subunit 3 n=1 Tax=Chamaeleo zeylanicus TaxID=420384 RepID=B7S6A8_CHAZE|nr:cytochrome c oxidase subunit III [Chamaeleo zeylanicus]ABM89688.1 cytochrome c oxidase subunit III [Chamaeleo zeylanicus]